MAQFQRPESPPPRQPSPDITLEALPHPRRVASQPKIRVHTPTIRGSNRTLHSMRSVDFLRDGHRTPVSTTSEDGHSIASLPSPRQRTRSSYLSPSSPSPSSPSSSPSPRNHRRTLSVAIPSPSPSPTPTMVQPLPPVPSVPAIYKGQSTIICPQPVSYKPYMLTPTDSEVTARSPPSASPSLLSVKGLPPLEKHKNMGVACLRFFRIKAKSPSSVTAV
ncbi:hypothetical protein CPB83DRAFT_889202 [Crepidotus variabilis]|uniref:Uncharacterized protein n=1 Tax=Crepidotus variabilis TaxID=179855 RepID=A0A9P6JVT0_9AGAR|nr:hypothetical protein CPB83DRAFT_889202 [Crepidotus variabilis]